MATELVNNSDQLQFQNGKFIFYNDIYLLLFKNHLRLNKINFKYNIINR
jgi:hypothetical protein